MEALEERRGADPRRSPRRRCAARLKRVGDLARDEVEHIERVSKSSAPFTGVETGFYRFDELTSGLQKQDLIILAARPGRRQDGDGAQHRRQLRRPPQAQGRDLLARDVRRCR